MATLSRGSDPERERRAAARECGACSHCCTILRVDELAKPASRDCIHQRGAEGCAIHETRPPICRGYRCLWLQGGLEDDERPDATGGIVDLEAVAAGVQLTIHEVHPGAFDASPTLQAIAERHREQMPVRVIGPEDIDDPDRPFRVLLAGGVEHYVEGEWTRVERPGHPPARRRLPWAERLARRGMIKLRAWRLRRSLAGDR